MSVQGPSERSELAGSLHSKKIKGNSRTRFDPCCVVQGAASESSAEVHPTSGQCINSPAAFWIRGRGVRTEKGFDSINSAQVRLAHQQCILSRLSHCHPGCIDCHSNTAAGFLRLFTRCVESWRTVRSFEIHFRTSGRWEESAAVAIFLAALPTQALTFESVANLVNPGGKSGSNATAV